MQVTIYGKSNCDYCAKAKFLSNLYKISYDYFDITDDGVTDEMLNKIPEDERQSIKTVPQIFVDGKHVGGFSEYEKFVITSRK